MLSSVKIKLKLLFFSFFVFLVGFCFKCWNSLDVVRLIFERHYNKSIEKEAVVLYCFYWLLRYKRISFASGFHNMKSSVV